MATPVDDHYVGPSGAVLAGGRNYWPAWRRAMSPRTWASVGNTLASIDPEDNPAINPNYPANAPWHASVGQSAAVIAWNGAVWDEARKRLWIPLCGGHQDYAGNETYIWDALTGQFSMEIPPTGAIGNTGTLNDGLESTGVYFDGRPRSYHTYGNLQMRNGEVWFFGGAVYASATGGLYPFRLAPTTKQWTKDCATAASGTGVSGAVCYDASRDRFWYVSSATQAQSYYDPASHQKVTLGGSITGDLPSSSGAYDSRRDLLVRLGAGLNLITNLDGTPVRTVITPTGSRPAANNGQTVNYLGMEGFVYDYANDRYLLWDAGTSLYVLTPPPLGQDPKTGTWAWSEMPASGENTVNPGAATYKGIYGRFWHSPKLSCCGVFNTVTQQMHVFALD